MPVIAYDRPFSAGPIASVRPGSLAVEYAVSYDAIVRLRDTLHQLGDLSKRVSRAAFRDEMTRAPAGVVDIIGALAHERDHVRRFLSTTYGFLCDTARCRLVRAVADAVAAVGVGPFFDPSSSGRERAEPGPAARPGGAGGGRLAGVHRLQHFLASVTDGAVRWGASPPGGGLTARHVLEMFAVLEQGNGLFRKGCAVDPVTRLLDTMSGEYSYLTDVWMAAFGVAGMEPITQPSRAADDLLFDWYRLFPFELYVAADLALWPPYLPDRGGLGEPGGPWADVSPAYRFVKTLAYYERVGVRPAPIPAARRNELFLELQAAVCRHYGWPTPAALAAAWSRALTTSLEAGRSYWGELDGPCLYRTANAVRLLALRLERPCDLVLNNVDFDRHRIDRPPVWVFTEPDGSKRPLPMRAGDPSLLFPFVVTEMTQFLVSRYRPSMTHLYDRKFREVAAEVYSIHLAQVGAGGVGAGELHGRLRHLVLELPDRFATGRHA
ncbi:MAG: hypothetical protein U0871_00955 [Gemmataceae bacterium]